MALAANLTRRLASVASPGSGTASKQLYFAAFLVLFTAVIALSHHEYVLTSTYLAALAVLVFATVLSGVVRWDELDARWGALVPLLDLVAVGMTRDLMRDTAIAVSLLACIPAFWLAGRLRLPGTLIATLAVIVTITAPSLLRAPHIDSLVIANSMLLPFTVLQIGLLTTGALKLLDGQNRRMAAALQEKAAALQEKEELLESTATWQRLLKNIIDSVDVGIVVVDRHGHDLLMNRAQRGIHELASPEDIEDPNESQLALLYPGTSCPIPPNERPVRRAVQQETFSNYVISVGAPGIEGTTLSTSARQIIDQHGNRDGAVVVFSDVTSYIEAARSQQQFVATVSHELRTPLTSVIGFLELAMDDPELEEEASGYLEVAHRNAEQLLTIVQDLLQDHLARSGSDELALRPTRLSEIAERAVESFTLHAAQEGITIHRDIQDTPVMQLDGPRLTQSLDNLLSNALKYTPRGGTVGVHSCVVEGAAEVNVADSGIGMSDQEQTNLFTDFYRTETARNSHIPGSGLGLALTRRIVLAHGGQISVRSTPGAGSTFTIRLPLHVEGDTGGVVSGASS